MRPQLYEVYKGIMTRFGDIYCAFEPPACTATQIDDLIACLEPGFILARGYDAYLDGHFIPGEYTHSGICINERQIIHSVAEGVCSVHPIDFVKDTDRFIVLYPPYVEMDDRFSVIDRAIWHADANKTQYDFTFAEDGKFYCHEFTADCLAAADIIIAKTMKKFGVWPFAFTRQLYLAQNLIDACTVVYEFNPSATTPDLSSSVVVRGGRPKDGEPCSNT